MATGSSGGDGNDRPPRMPKNMKGLLQLCAQATDPENTTQVEPLSDEVDIFTVSV